MTYTCTAGMAMSLPANKRHVGFLPWGITTKSPTAPGINGSDFVAAQVGLAGSRSLEALCLYVWYHYFLQRRGILRE